MKITQSPYNAIVRLEGQFRQPPRRAPPDAVIFRFLLTAVTQRLILDHDPL